ncbi:MAG: TVP38/TMEM64 family protein [Ruminococcus sp.]|nr:TVP38/TMEM64 family protein [Ruminococcus sp.]
MHRDNHFISNKKYAIVSLVTSLLIIGIFVFFIANTDTDEILNYRPDNLWLAAFVFFGFYGLKSLSVVIPLSALFISIGSIYPFPIAVLINIIGLSVSFTVPYLVGRISGGDVIGFVEEKYPKVKKIVNYGHDNNLFASYISRAVVVVPGDVVSLIHGALRMPYRPYLLGSLLGVMPEMLVHTYIGGSLRDLSWKSFLVMIGMIAATLAFSLILNKRISRAGKNADKNDF